MDQLENSVIEGTFEEKLFDCFNWIVAFVVVQLPEFIKACWPIESS